MADSIREIIIKDIIARLAVVTRTNGYQTDCGENVYRVRKRPDENNELPCLTVWPLPETAKKIMGGLQCEMNILIAGLAHFGAENPSVVSEQILADIVEVMTSTSWSRSPDYFDSVIYAGGGTDEYPDDIDVVVGSQATFTIGYSVALGDPYNQ